MAHAQLGEGNLLIYVGTTGSVLEFDADHLVLVSSKQLLNSVDVVVHHGRVDGVHHLGIRLHPIPPPPPFSVPDQPPLVAAPRHHARARAGAPQDGAQSQQDPCLPRSTSSPCARSTPPDPSTMVVAPFLRDQPLLICIHASSLTSSTFLLHPHLLAGKPCLLVRFASRCSQDPSSPCCHVLPRRTTATLCFQQENETRPDPAVAFLRRPGLFPAGSRQRRPAPGPAHLCRRCSSEPRAPL